MFSKRLISRLGASASSNLQVRTFTHTSHFQKAPALSDIVPGQQEAFDRKQVEFRQELTRKTKAQREQERQSASSTAAKSSTPYASVTPDNAVTLTSDKGLGSLSTATGESARQNEEENKGEKKKSTGRWGSLIYGTEEGREMDREIERSFSQVLARGKYVHSIVFHEVKPDKVDEYVELVGGWYPKVADNPENKVHLVGSWRTEVGDCDTFGTHHTYAVVGHEICADKNAL